MTTKPRQVTWSKKTSVQLFGSLGFLLMLFACLYLFFTIKVYEGNFLFGLMPSAVIEMVFFILVALTLLIVAIASLISWNTIAPLLERIITQHASFLKGFFIIGLILGWAAFTIPPNFFHNSSEYYRWLRPALGTWGLITVIGLTLYLFDSGKLLHLDETTKVVKTRVFFLVFLSLSTVFGVAYLSGFGLVSDTPLWNVPGIPISGIQMFFAVIIFVLLTYIEQTSPKFRSLLLNPRVQTVLLLIIFFGTVIVWGLTPLNGDSLSLTTSNNNPEPYPLRDAKVHDLGALSILYGEGIFFKGYTDKPLYMVIVSIYHLIAGYDYHLIQWAQIVFLSIIPIFAFLLSTRYHSPLFGLLTVFMIVTQQQNAIALSRIISSVNVKILATETTVLLGIVMLTFILFKWNNENSNNTLLIGGGIVACLSLIRLNPLLLLPYLALLVAFYYRKQKKEILPGLMYLMVGFFIIFIPWTITGVSQSGKSFLYLKVKDILENRVDPLIISPTNNSVIIATPSSADIQLTSYRTQSLVAQSNHNQDQSQMINQPHEQVHIENSVVSGNSFTQYFTLMTSHYVHNIITSIMPLPDILTHDPISKIAKRNYWSDEMIWDGKLRGALIRFIVINIGLISLGVSYGWKKHRWRGLIPLSIFLVYNFAISVSLTSGGRYIVPIIWIVFFYYGMGFAFLADSIIRLLLPDKSWDREKEQLPKTIVNKKKPLPVIIILVFVALLIPVSNLLVPSLVRQNPAEKAALVFITSGMEQTSSNNLQYGTVLYPIYESGSDLVEFDFYSGREVKRIAIVLTPEGTSKLNEKRLVFGEPILLEYNNQNQLIRIFLIRNNQVVIFWKLLDS